MKIGIISDLHSNPDAFEAVLAEFDRRQVEKLLFLGDVIGLGAHPEECTQLLMQQRSRLLGAVRGNHENYLINGLPEHNHNDPNREIIPQETIDLFKWNHTQLSKESHDWLVDLPISQTVETDGAKIFITHYPADTNEHYRDFFYKPNASECEHIFEGYDADVYFYGHTHIYNEVKGGKFYANPGSVGCPIETDSASAGILDLSNGEINYERIDVNYDIDKAIADMRELVPKYPAAGFMIRRFYRKD